MKTQNFLFTTLSFVAVLAFAQSSFATAPTAEPTPKPAPRPLTDDIAEGLKRAGDTIGAEVQKGERAVRKNLRGEKSPKPVASPSPAPASRS